MLSNSDKIVPMKLHILLRHTRNMKNDPNSPRTVARYVAFAFNLSILSHHVMPSKILLINEVFKVNGLQINGRILRAGH